MVHRLAKWLEMTTLLQNIRKWQHDFDYDDERFLCAMTLRDCTVFIRSHNTKPVEDWECRIGDLDLKSPDKAEYWRSVEGPLIEEGWYEGTEREEDRQPNFCNLADSRFCALPGYEHIPI